MKKLGKNKSVIILLLTMIKLNLYTILFFTPVILNIYCPHFTNLRPQELCDAVTKPLTKPWGSAVLPDGEQQN